MATKRKQRQKQKQQNNPNNPHQQKKFILNPKSINQARYIDAINHNKIIICTGPAGSGKSMIATSMAMIGLIEERYDRIIITRPLVEAGEHVGILPGDINKKLHPFIRPVLDEMEKFYPKWEIDDMIRRNVIEIVPIGFMRGRNFHNSFIIVDEAENCTKEQLKLVLTRFGRNSKMVINGDITQTDLATHKRGALEYYMACLENISNLKIVKLTRDDIVRERIIATILDAMDKYDEDKAQKNVGIKC